MNGKGKTDTKKKESKRPQKKKYFWEGLFRVSKFSKKIYIYLSPIFFCRVLIKIFEKRTNNTLLGRERLFVALESIILYIVIIGFTKKRPQRERDKKTTTTTMMMMMKMTPLKSLPTPPPPSRRTRARSLLSPRSRKKTCIFSWRRKRSSTAFFPPPWSSRQSLLLPFFSKSFVLINAFFPFLFTPPTPSN